MIYKHKGGVESLDHLCSSVTTGIK